jgi:hypothetical protein
MWIVTVVFIIQLDNDDAPVGMDRNFYNDRKITCFVTRCLCNIDRLILCANEFVQLGRSIYAKLFTANSIVGYFTRNIFRRVAHMESISNPFVLIVVQFYGHDSGCHSSFVD